MAKKESKKDNKAVDSVAGYLKAVKEIINKKGGGFIFRGQKNESWEKVSSCVERRFEKSGYEPEKITWEIIIENQKEIIFQIKKSLRHFSTDRPELELKEMEILAEIQHYGGATLLIDFTKNALNALWFACEPESLDKKDNKQPKEKDGIEPNGVVYLFDTSDPQIIKDINAESTFEEIITIKQNTDGKEETTFESEKPKETILEPIKQKIFYWEPGRISQRVFSQCSVFVFGDSSILNEKLSKIVISGDRKRGIREELTKIHNISDMALFDDFYGFAWANRIESLLKKPQDKKKIEYIAQDPYEMGLYELERKNFDKAIEYFTQEIIRNPKNIISYYYRASAKNRKGDLGGAIEDYNKAIELDPKNDLAYMNRGNVRGKKSEFDLAIEDHTKAIELDPKNALAYYNRGISRNRKGDLDLAIEDHTKAIELDPKNAHFYNNRGNARENKNDFTGAIKDYNKALELDPKFASAYFNRGIARGKKGDLDLAIEDYTKAIGLDLEIAPAYMNRGNAESKIGKHDEALEDFKRAFELFDDDMYKKYVAGLICREEGKKEEARKYLEEALAIAKKKNNIWMIKKIEETLKDL